MTLMIIFVVTFVAFALVISGMAVGVMVGRREISGSCGGLGNQTGDGEQPACSLCSDPDAACRELRDAMAADGMEESADPASSAQVEHSAAAECQLPSEPLR